MSSESSRAGFCHRHAAPEAVYSTGNRGHHWEDQHLEESTALTPVWASGLSWSVGPGGGAGGGGRTHRSFNNIQNGAPALSPNSRELNRCTSHVLNHCCVPRTGVDSTEFTRLAGQNEAIHSLQNVPRTRMDSRVCGAEHSHPVQYVGTPSPPDATDPLPWAAVRAGKRRELDIASTSLLLCSSSVGSTESCALKARPPQLCTPPNALNNRTAWPLRRGFPSAWGYSSVCGIL